VTLLAADFDSLVIDERFETRGRTVTEADVASFACLTGDVHPQHTDAVFAASSAFGERIAHGMLVVSYVIGLLPFDPSRVIALRRVRDTVFKRPVALGDTIHAVGRIERLDEIDPSTGLVGLRLDVRNQREKLVARVALDVVWRRGSLDGAAAAEAPGAEEPFVLAGLPI
jgi:3-hydroxybutyryl-CoA dehydratase